MTSDWHDWHKELNQATETYNALLKRLAEENKACIRLEIEERQASNGILYSVLDWQVYAAPMASCVQCSLANGNPIHGKR